MIEQKPVPPKKDTAWIWIVVSIAVVLLCLAVVLVGAGAYAVYKGYITIPRVSMPQLTSPTLPTPNAPSPSNPFTVPTPGNPSTAPTSITVEPYQPQQGDNYPGLQDLATAWQNPSGPGTNTYNISVSFNQPVLLYQGWCTSTKTILDQNMQHIQYVVEVDGKALDVSKLYQESLSSVGQSCKDFSGIIRAWPLGSHTIKISMRVDAKINDGWNDYAAGDYTEVYTITVTQ